MTETLESSILQEIDESLSAYLDFGEGCPPNLAEAIRYAALGPGKRLRPQLVLLAAQACGCDRKRVLPAACAVEFIHAYSLVHDDLPAMDDDDLRRGRATCHRAYDEATAILVGDALQAKAFEILAREIEPSQLASDCCRELASAAGAEGMVGGQADDLSPPTMDGNLAELESIHRRKTGALLTVSLRLGGLIARTDDDRLERLTTYGRKLGLAFQIVDDLLDYDGNEASVGKKTGKDLDRGKLTFPGLLGVSASRRRARQLVKDATRALEPFGDRATGLNQLASFVVSRDH